MRQLNIIILSVCLALISTSVWSQKSFFPANPSASVFQKLTSIDGLSQGSINIIVQDKNGFIWIGTNDGLNRYDGYNINVYRNNVDDTLSISCNQIRKILIDNNNILWIGTEKGLNRFDPRGSKFQHHSNIKLGADVFVQNMDIDENGKIWIISKDSRLISSSTIN
ncbi:MAG: two-component regulator propeller domain-containing protein, partial [Bacteroidota bacterium]|nr:two-component regulator propeller domain-containing protein [Bacteroidota bacterium]